MLNKITGTPPSGWVITQIAELKSRPNTFYLSFADEQGFLGATAIEAECMEDAITKSHALGINPGGQVMIVHVPPYELDDAFITCCKNRLATKDELIALGGVVRII